MDNKSISYSIILSLICSCFGDDPIAISSSAVDSPTGSGSPEITVSNTGGGSSEITVSKDGAGTSKITVSSYGADPPAMTATTTEATPTTMTASTTEATPLPVTDTTTVATPPPMTEPTTEATTPAMTDPTTTRPSWFKSMIRAVPQAMINSMSDSHKNLISNIAKTSSAKLGDLWNKTSEASTGMFNNVTDKNPISTVGVMLSWAETHINLTVRILTFARNLTEFQIQNIPGAKFFLEILAEAVHWHSLKEKIDQRDNKLTISNVVDAFLKHHNYSISDVPFMSESLMKGEKEARLPDIIDLIRSVIRPQNGIPFGRTVIAFYKMMGANIFKSSLANSTATLVSNLTNFWPFIEDKTNSTIGKWKNASVNLISNMTDYNDVQIKWLGSITKNVTSNVFGGVRNLTQNMVDYGKNSFNQTKTLINIIMNLTDRQQKDFIEYFNIMQTIPKELFTDPRKGGARMTDKSLKVVMDSIEKVNELTDNVNQLAWSNLKDISMIGQRAGENTVESWRQVTNLGAGIARHAYDSASRLASLTKHMNPFHRSDTERDEPSPTTNTNQTRGFFTDMPLIGRLPGVAVIQTMFDRFPEIKLLDFEKLMNVFDNFRIKPSTDVKN